MNETDDRAIIETARAAIQRDAAEYREMYADEPDEAQAMRILGAELHAEGCVTTLSNLDPTQPLTSLGSEALYVGYDDLQREAEGWRQLAAGAVDERWRGEFQAVANETQRQADEVLALRGRLAERDRDAEREAER
jgi:hypothetical protein